MRPAFLSLLALLAPLCFGGPAAAQSVQPLDRLLPEIRRTHPGQFYDADGPHPGAGGSQHYHLKWMTPDGRIVWYDTDARTGRVLGASPGRDNFDPRGDYDRRFYERQNGPRDDAPRESVPRGHYRDDPQESFGQSYGGRWSGPRVDGPRGNGQVYGGPGFDNRTYGGAFGGGRYGGGGYNHGGGYGHGGGGGGHSHGGR